MAKKRPENPSAEPQPQAAKPTKTKPPKKRPVGELAWHPFWRCLVSLLVIVHLTAVFSAPWDLSVEDALPPGFEMQLNANGVPQPPPPASELWQKPVVPESLHKFFHHYLNVLYINHGYEFFAPDPSGTHVIDYQVTKSNGNIVEGRFPSHEDQWPRLLYHRHMMLAEQTLMPAMGPNSARQYADHLATLHGGTSRLQLKYHGLLLPQQVASGMELDAPSTYRIIGEAAGRPRPSATSPAPTAEAPIPIPGAQQ